MLLLKWISVSRGIQNPNSFKLLQITIVGISCKFHHIIFTTWLQIWIINLQKMKLSMKLKLLRWCSYLWEPLTSWDLFGTRQFFPVTLFLLELWRTMVTRHPTNLKTNVCVKWSEKRDHYNGCVISYSDNWPWSYKYFRGHHSDRTGLTGTEF